MAARGSEIYEFGSFQLDPVERVLLDHGEVVSLTPKAFDLLSTLVRSSGRVVEKEDLMAEIWPDTFVEENNLTVTMSALRKALGEPRSGQSYIQTIPRRGYRFAASVRRSVKT